MKTTVLITQAEYDKAASVFTSASGLDCQPAPADEAGLADKIRATGCHIVVLGVVPYRDMLYEALAKNATRQGALIIRFGLGTDGIRKSMAKEKNILLVNTPIDIHTSVAELTVFQIGALMRHTLRLDDTVRSGGFAPLRGRELYGKTALIIGGGKIGLKVARMLHQGFGVRILTSSRRSEEAWVTASGYTRLALRETYGIETYAQNLEPLLPQADIVSLHLPLTPETRNLIGAKQLARMKPGSVLVNASRGGIVDEAALYDALNDDHLAGAAADVFTHEPYMPVVPDKDLRKLPSMIFSPHCGSNTIEANARMATSAVAQALAFACCDNTGLSIVPLSP